MCRPEVGGVFAFGPVSMLATKNNGGQEILLAAAAEAVQPHLRGGDFEGKWNGSSSPPIRIIM